MLKERLKKVRIKNKLSQYQLAKLAGVTQSAIAHIESGRNKASKQMPSIAKALGTTVEWLVYGTESIVSYEDNDSCSDDINIPFMLQSWDVNGESNIYMQNNDQFKFSASMLKSKGIDCDNVICYEISGDYMMPSMQNQTILAVNKGQKNIKEGGVYLIVYRGVLQVKYLNRNSASSIKLSCDNKKYDDIICNFNELEVIGEVFWMSTFM